MDSNSIREDSWRHLMDFTVHCTDPICQDQPAYYKIAAEWTGGGYHELKTFGFANDLCVDRVFYQALERAAQIQLAKGETLGRVGIYQLDISKHDNQLERYKDLEARLLAARVAPTASLLTIPTPATFMPVEE